MDKLADGQLYVTGNCQGFTSEVDQRVSRFRLSPHKYVQAIRTAVSDLIEGGTGPNIIPDRCTITASRRLVPGEVPAEEFNRIRDIAVASCPLPVEVVGRNGAKPDGPMGAPAFYLPADSPLASNFASWAGTAPTVAPFGTNALAYSGLANETIVFGPGCIDDAHQATECVRISDLAKLADVYTKWLQPH